MLSPKAFGVLRFLAENAARLVSSEELFSHLWPDTFVQPENLKKYILEIRKAFGDDAKEARFIETLPRRGYRLIARVDLINFDPADGVHSLQSERIVGREEPLRALDSYLRKALAGEPQVVFVTGEAGIGKTALVDAFRATTAGTTVRFLAGQCIEGHGGQEPYYPLLEALTEYCRTDTTGAAVATLATAAPTWLAQLPVLVEGLAARTASREFEPASKQRMLREICAALAHMSGREPLVFIVEDLHWSDPSTVDFFEAIARRRAPARLMLIGTYRPIDVVVSEHPIKRIKRELALHSLCREIALFPLRISDAGECLARIAEAPQPPGDLVQSIFGPSEGNPLFMAAALDYLLAQKLISIGSSGWQTHAAADVIQAAIPDSLRELVELRIGRLSEREHSILDAASAAGVNFTAFEVAAALLADSDAVETELERLCEQSRIFRHASRRAKTSLPGEESFEFAHAVYREVFYRRLPPSLRRNLHRQLALSLESRLGSAAAQAAPELALHFERALDWPRAIRYLFIAASHAAAVHALAEARTALRQALELAGRLAPELGIQTEIDVLERLSSVEHASGLLASAIESGELMLRKARELGVADMQLRALLHLTRVLRWTEPAKCSAMLEQAEALPGISAHPALLEMRIEVSYWQMASGWSQSAAEKGEAAFRELRKHADRCTVARCAVTYSQFLQFASRYEEARSNLHQAIPALHETSDSSSYYLASHYLENCLLYLGHWGELQKSNEFLLKLAHELGDKRREQGAALSHIWLCLECFDFAQAQSICGAILAPEADDRTILIALQVRIQAGLAESGLGNHAGAIAWFEQTQDLIAHQPHSFDWYYRAPLHLGMAEARLAKGDIQNAEMEVVTLMRAVEAACEKTWHSRALEFAARLAMTKGDLGRAEHNLDRALAILQNFDLPLAAWRVHRTATDLYGRLNRPTIAEDHARQSRDAVHRIASSLDADDQLRSSFLCGALHLKSCDLSETQFVNQPAFLR